MRAPLALLLAAGASRRFGRDKLVEPLPDGTPIAVAACKRYLAAGLAVHAVLRPEQTTLATQLTTAGASVHFADSSRAGLGASLAAGVAATPAAGGWIVGLADMPFVRPETIAAVRDTIARGALIAAPHVAGQRGHPVGFAPVFAAALMRLRGDTGARHLLEAAGDTLTLIACDDPGALRDIDIPADLAAVLDAPGEPRR